MKPIGVEPGRHAALFARRFYKGARAEIGIPSRTAVEPSTGRVRATIGPPVTTPSRRPPVAILGAGFAGLVVANELVRRGIDVVVLEAGARVAGLATSHRDRDGFHHDVGAHFITNRLASEIGIGAECRTLARYGEAVITGGRAYGYPYGLLRVPRFLRGALASRLGGGADSPETAAEWFRAQYGSAARRRDRAAARRGLVGDAGEPALARRRRQALVEHRADTRAHAGERRQRTASGARLLGRETGARQAVARLSRARRRRAVRDPRAAGVGEDPARLAGRAALRRGRPRGGSAGDRPRSRRVGGGVDVAGQRATAARARGGCARAVP
ncbi:MAG: NAD(P)-binding protein [Deltaproteobacteria bacterium]|nr:NAD(P)-binding protein [Deltaproteobacteria bacterium]